MDSALPVLLICISLILLYSSIRRSGYGYMVLKRRRKSTHLKEIDIMSKMLEELVGKEVRIFDIILGSTVSGTVIEVDDKWLKLEKKNKKDEVVYTKIVSIESIGNIEIK